MRLRQKQGCGNTVSWQARVARVVTRLIGAIRLEPNKWAAQRARYMPLESVAPFGDDPINSLPPVAAA